jgi:DNA polymerase I
MGKVVYAEPGFVKSDYRRRPIKNTMYGMSYGAGPAKISITAGIPEEQAREVRTSILGAFPGLSRSMQRFETEVKENGEITTLKGRRIVVDPNKAYRGLNAFIQGTAADLFKHSVVQLAHAGFEDHMVVPVHDEVVFSIPEPDIEEARHVIDKAMTIDDIDPFVPVTASAGLATWGSDQ